MESTAIDRFSPAYALTHLGASQVPQAIGVSPFRRPIDLWRWYMGLDADEPDSERFDLGHALESGIIGLAARRLGVDLLPGPQRTIEHPDYPWLCATPDALTIDGANIQAKTVGMTGMVRAETRDAWGEPGTGEVPTYVAAQVMIEMAVLRANQLATLSATDTTHTHVVALIAGRGLCIYRVDFSQVLADHLIGKAREFWQYVQTKTTPPIDGSEAYRDHLRRQVVPKSDTWREDAEAEAALDALLDAEAALDAAKAAHGIAEQKCMELIGPMAGLRSPRGRIGFSPRDGRRALNKDALLTELVRRGVADAAAIINAATVAGKPYRQFGPFYPSKKERSQ